MFLSVVTTSETSISLSPVSEANFVLPSEAMIMVESKLCNSLLLVKTVHWAVSQSAWPRLNSTLPLLANLTSVELYTICNDTLQLVRTLVV